MGSIMLRSYRCNADLSNALELPFAMIRWRESWRLPGLGQRKGKLRAKGLHKLQASHRLRVGIGMI